MKKTLSIDGMMCMHCVGSVEKALKALPGVQAVTVDLQGKCATVEAEDGVSGQDLEKAVTSQGFRVVGIA